MLVISCKIFRLAFQLKEEHSHYSVRAPNKNKQIRVEMRAYVL